MFKNPKLFKIAKLSRNDKELLTIPVLIEVETYDTNDDEILFYWKEYGEDCGKHTYLIED